MAEEYETIQREFERVKDAWLARESVTGMDIGFKMVAGQQTPQLAIRVYVREKLPPEQIPPREGIPQEVDGIPVDVLEGTITLT